LPRLAAGPHAGVERHVVADRADLLQRRGPSPISVAPFTGAPILPFFTR
jgi:hypothetical protein